MFGSQNMENYYENIKLNYTCPRFKGCNTLGKVIRETENLNYSYYIYIHTEI